MNLGITIQMSHRHRSTKNQNSWQRLHQTSFQYMICLHSHMLYRSTESHFRVEVIELSLLCCCCQVRSHDCQASVWQWGQLLPTQLHFRAQRPSSWSLVRNSCCSESVAVSNILRRWRPKRSSSTVLPGCTTHNSQCLARQGSSTSAMCSGHRQLLPNWVTHCLDCCLPNIQTRFKRSKS